MGGLAKFVGRLFGVSEPSSDFLENPEQYHRRVIKISGQVEKILKNPAKEILKRKAIDLFRDITKNSDPRGRYVHQRFVLSSDALARGENILVLHNVEFGRKAISNNTWLEVQGVYLHSTSVVKTLFGHKPTKYGRIHYTHKPKGYIKVLGRKPAKQFVRLDS